ncbi:hypothetical protein LTR53_018626, partial [Teratosphaeriaceae sp. CCFEE 6253]
GLLHALARVVAPTVFNAIYSATVGKFTQTVFVCLTATFGLAFVISWFIRPHVYLDPNDMDSAENDAPPGGAADAQGKDGLPVVSSIVAAFGAILAFL